MRKALIATTDGLLSEEDIERQEDTLIYIMEVEKLSGSRVLVVEIREGEDGNAVLYKTWMPTREKPYPKLAGITPMSVGGVSTISRSDNNQNPAVSLFALDIDKSNLNSLPAFVKDLDNIISGKHDTDTDKIDVLLNQTVMQAKKLCSQNIKNV